MLVKVQMKPVSTILRRLGVQPDGDVQKQTTRVISNRMTKYMPYRSGALATKLKIIANPTEIHVLGPYAKYQYYGVVMVDPKTGAAGFLTEEGWRSRRGVPKVVTSRSLNYDKTKNPQAGPFWERRMMAAEGEQIAREIQAYVNRRGSR